MPGRADDAPAADPDLQASRRWSCCCAFTASPSMQQQLTHHYGDAIGVAGMLRCAKELKLKARVDRQRLGPACQHAASGHRRAARRQFLSSSAKSPRTGALIHDPAVGRPQVADRAEFEAAVERPAHPDDAPGGPWRARRAASTSPGSCRRCTNTAGFWARCWSPRSSCSSLRWSRRCSSRWSSTRCWCIAA